MGNTVFNRKELVFQQSPTGEKARMRVYQEISFLSFLLSQESIANPSIVILNR